MPLAGDFLPYSTPGEMQPYAIDFAAQISTGESISSVTSALTVAKVTPAGFNGTDLSPSTNLVGPPAFAGTVCSQNVGPLQANVVYLLIFTVTTTAGRTLINYGHIYSQAPT